MKPTVIINVTGGIVQCAGSDAPADLILVDYDTDGTPDEWLTTDDEGDRCIVESVEVKHLPDWVAWAKANADKARVPPGKDGDPNRITPEEVGDPSGGDSLPRREAQ